MALVAALPSRGKERQGRQLRQEGRGNVLASSAVTLLVYMCCTMATFGICVAHM